MAIESTVAGKFEEERVYMALLVSNTSVLKEVYFALDTRFMSNNCSRIITEWVKEYYDQTGEAPVDALPLIYQRKRSSLTPQVQDDIFTYIRGIMDPAVQIRTQSPDYTVDSLIEYFRLQSLREIYDKVGKCLDRRQVGDAEAIIGNYNRIVKSKGEDIDFFASTEEVMSALEHKEERLFRLPGVLGDTIGWFVKGDLVGLCGGTGTGKSVMAVGMATEALRAGLNVLYFNFEIFKPQMTRRVTRALLNLAGEDVQSVERPIFTPLGQKKKISRQTVPARSFPKTEEELSVYMEQAQKDYPGNLRIINYTRGEGNTIANIETDIQNLIDYENFIPQVIVVDLADLLKPKERFNNKPDAENAVWQELAALAMKGYIVISPTQGNRQAIDGNDGNIGALGGSYTKMTHTGKFIIIFCNEKEKEQGILHAKMLKERDGKFVADDVIMLRSLDEGLWYVDSAKASDIDHKKEEVYTG